MAVTLSRAAFFRGQSSGPPSLGGSSIGRASHLQDARIFPLFVRHREKVYPLLYFKQPRALRMRHFFSFVSPQRKRLHTPTNFFLSAIFLLPPIDIGVILALSVRCDLGSDICESCIYSIHLFQIHKHSAPPPLSAVFLPFVKKWFFSRLTIDLMQGLVALDATCPPRRDPTLTRVIVHPVLHHPCIPRDPMFTGLLLSRHWEHSIWSTVSLLFFSQTFPTPFFCASTPPPCRLSSASFSPVSF